ncbi:MAG: sporulation membrane protein YtaF [Clostridium sp.]|nr:sporulation membrane protein YtaF [Clostridium sp.]
MMIVILLIAFVSNLDNFAVGVSYGARKIFIPFKANFIIAIITGLGTLISMILGKFISNIFTTSEANFLGGLVIVLVGVWIFAKELIDLLKKKKGINECEEKNIDRNIQDYGLIREIPRILENPFLADNDFSGYISMRESVVLGSALAINNMANGIGAGLAGLNPIATALSAFVISLIFVWIGIKLGHDYIYNFLGKISGPIAGIILIILGIYEMFC